LKKGAGAVRTEATGHQACESLDLWKLILRGGSQAPNRCAGPATLAAVRQLLRLPPVATSLPDGIGGSDLIGGEAPFFDAASIDLLAPEFPASDHVADGGERDLPNLGNFSLGEPRQINVEAAAHG
jgi:hypothetical protein